MQNLINANQKSTTQQIFNDIGTVIPYYKESPSYPPLGIQFHVQYPTIPVTGSIATKSCLIDMVSGGGFLYDVSISMLCTCTVTTADLDIENYPGINLINYMQWESNGKILVYKTKNSIMTQIKQNKNEAYKLHTLRYAQILNKDTELKLAAGAGEFLTYLSVWESFLTKPEKALLIDNLKDLKLRITFDSVEKSGMTNSVESAKIAMLCQTYMPKLSVYNEMKVNNWSKSFLMEMINCDEEVFPLSEATTSTIQVNTSFLVAKTHISLRAINATPGVGLPYGKINTIKFVLNGSILLDGTILPSRLSSCAARYANSHVTVNDRAVSYEKDDIITIDWGVLCGRDMNSGTAFFQELRGSKITLTYSTVTTGDYNIFLNHEYWQGVTYNPGNGGGSLTIESVS